jgi:MerR family transcriptional regulator, thiopeptide resistance regulator
MMTVSTLARRCGLTRSTVLYYEARGLIARPPRTTGNYRAYSEAHLRRLQQVCMYRKVGLPLADIRAVLGVADRTAPQGHPGTGPGSTAAILERRLLAIDAEIEQLRGHQRAILGLLQQSRTRKGMKMITKDKWVAIMRAAGLDDQAMHRWHREFEKAAPSEHQEFLEFLHIASPEIETIRKWSRGEQKA